MIGIDAVILAICVLMVYVTYSLWCLLGKKGLTTWLVIAAGYSVLLRIVSLLADTSIYWDVPAFVNYSRVLALPMYICLLLGLFGLLREVKDKLDDPAPRGWWHFLKSCFRKT